MQLILRCAVFTKQFSLVMLYSTARLIKVNRKVALGLFQIKEIQIQAQIIWVNQNSNHQMSAFSVKFLALHDVIAHEITRTNYIL